MKKNDDFYEVMPYAQGTPYRDDLIEDSNDYQEQYDAAELDARAKRTAIVTLVMVALVTLVLILAIVLGLQLLQTASSL